ncbi:MAG: LCP family protein [Clostridia bacterium]|nr:LCP family protein [Clostridia bacterium]
MIVRKDEEFEMLAIDMEKAARTKRIQQRVRLGLRWGSWGLFALEVLAVISFVVYVGILSFLPTLYFAVLLIVAVSLLAVQYMALRLQKRPAGTSIISLVMSVVMLVSSISGVSLLRFFYESIYNSNKGSNVSTILVSIYVKQESSYQDLEDLEYCTFGVRPDEMNDTTEKAVARLRTSLNNHLKVTEYTDYDALIAALKDDSVDAIILDQVLFSNIKTNIDSTFTTWARALPTNLRVEQSISLTEVSVSKTPFIVYISGVDTRDGWPTQDNGLSDVNQIAVVNPKAKKILLINTPRDTYVPLLGDTTKMDKLTHAGVYGLNCSMGTLEALYDIQFNYYVRVNFHSLINIIDALGGITVQADFNFTTIPDASLYGNVYTFYKGPNYITGDKALAFARHRYNMPGGDMQRGVHQQRIMEAVFKKLTTATALSNFSDIMKAITNNTKTTISSGDINELLQMQLKDHASWEIETCSLNGYGMFGTLYAFGDGIKYDVLGVPEDQLTEIKDKIKDTLRAHIE